MEIAVKLKKNIRSFSMVSVDEFSEECSSLVIQFTNGACRYIPLIGIEYWDVIPDGSEEELPEQEPAIGFIVPSQNEDEDYDEDYDEDFKIK